MRVIRSASEINDVSMQEVTLWLGILAIFSSFALAA
jgi:hypothetical protein